MSIGPPIHPRINTAVSRWSEIWRCVAHPGVRFGSGEPLPASMIGDSPRGCEGKAVTPRLGSSAAAIRPENAGSARG